MPISLDLGTITWTTWESEISGFLQKIHEFMDEFMNEIEQCAFPNIRPGIHLRLAKNILDVTIVMLIWNAFFRR
jgi:hypothetical protein